MLEKPDKARTSEDMCSVLKHLCFFDVFNNETGRFADQQTGLL